MTLSRRFSFSRSGAPDSTTVPLGMGSWVIGGQVKAGPLTVGWADVDERESLATIDCARERGVRFFDTADVYGAGRSERLLGRALGAQRADVVLATKFGGRFDESEGRLLGGHFADAASIRAACERSLRRLRTDYIDLYQFHWSDCELQTAAQVRDTLVELVEQEKIRSFGWSTNDPGRAAFFAQAPGCAAVQHTLNVVQDHPDMLAVCEKHALVSVCRSPLGMGLLTGKYRRGARAPAHDVRGLNLPWNVYFHDGVASESWLAALDDIHEILTSRGRTPAQGALAWIWARSPRALPIPGLRSPEQAAENLDALELGALDPSQMAEIDRILDRPRLAPEPGA